MEELADGYHVVRYRVCKCLVLSFAQQISASRLRGFSMVFSRIRKMLSLLDRQKAVKTCESLRAHVRKDGRVVYVPTVMSVSHWVG